MNLQLSEKLRSLKGSAVTNVTAENGSALVELDGCTRIYAGYWRLIQGGRARVSSFDHGQKYGLPNAVDAVLILSNVLRGQRIESCTIDDQTADIRLAAVGGIVVEIFNFTGNEDWEITFADGTSTLSNYFQPRVDA